MIFIDTLYSAVLPFEPHFKHRVGEYIPLPFFLDEVTFGQHPFVSGDGLCASQAILLNDGGRI